MTDSGCTLLRASGQALDLALGHSLRAPSCQELKR